MPTPQRSVMSMTARAKVPARSCGLLSSEMRIWPSWVVGSIDGRGEPQAALEVRQADHPHGHLLAGRDLGKPLARHFRREFEIALGDEGEQRLGPRRGRRAHHGEALGDDARHRCVDVDRRAAAVERGEPHQRLPGFDGFAGLGEHPGDLHPLALRPDQHLLPRHQDAGDLDRILEAGALRLHHRDRSADRIGRGLRGQARRRAIRPTTPAQAAATAIRRTRRQTADRRPRTTFCEAGLATCPVSERRTILNRATPAKIALRRARQRRP